MYGGSHQLSGGREPRTAASSRPASATSYYSHFENQPIKNKTRQKQKQKPTNQTKPKKIKRKLLQLTGFGVSVTF